MVRRIGMGDQSYREILREVALDNYGYVTIEDAVEVGVPAIELAKLAQRKKGRFENIAYGLYRDNSIPESPLGYLAEAVLRSGKGAYLHGESVLAMHDLALVNPRHISVASLRPARKTLPASIRLTKAKEGVRVTEYEGIPSQPVADAILECRKTIEPERLAQAARDARSQGLITSKEWETVKKGLGL
ncbi:hypothetical protein ACN082_07850 [Rothia sp. CCM 9417]|uniref:hypothetical protein n=1 Tax=Rothia sp. CCM 9417 TaxID=3402657 RepID=UPI003AEEE6E3